MRWGFVGQFTSHMLLFGVALVVFVGSLDLAITRGAHEMWVTVALGAIVAFLNARMLAGLIEAHTRMWAKEDRDGRADEP